MNAAAPGDRLADRRVREFLARHSDADANQLLDGSWAVRVRDIPLDQNIWSKATATVGFVIPAAFPIGRPDCFVADADLCHRNGGMPANSAVNVQPHFGLVRWFSYHPMAWDIRDTVETFFRLILTRLVDPR